MSEKTERPERTQMSYKVDWFAFSVENSLDTEGSESGFKILESLGYEVNDFEEIEGRYFYNSGLTLGRYVNIYYNDYTKQVLKNSSHTRNYVFTGQGCTDLAKRIENDWIHLFKTLVEFGVNVTRLDLAIDDFNQNLDFDKIERKLNKGHYKSRKKSYNVVKEANVNGDIKGYTIYIGARRASSGYYCRMYDKFAQYKSKMQLPPEQAIETGSWQRYEISYTKKKASMAVEKMISGETMGEVYKGTMRAIVDFLVEDKTQQNKARWKVCDWWEEFLEGATKIKLGNPEMDADIERTLKWFRQSCLPSLQMLNEICKRLDVDFYELLKGMEIVEFSKKQNRLIEECKAMPDEVLALKFNRFVEEEM